MGDGVENHHEGRLPDLEPRSRTGAMVVVSGPAGSPFSLQRRSYPAPDALVDALVETMWALPGVRIGVARLADNRLRYLACSGPENIPELTGHSIKLDAAPAFLEALQFSDSAVYFEDVSADRRTRALAPVLERLRCRSLLVVPICRNRTSELAGVLSLDAAKPRTWGKKELAALDRILGIAELTLDNAHLLDELQAANTERQEAVRRLGVMRAVATSVIHDTTLLTQGLMSEIRRAHSYLSGPAADDIRHSAEALGHQLEGVLSELIAAEHGAARSLDPVDLNRTVSGLAPALRALVGPGIQLLTSLEPGPLLVPGNAPGLERMLLNLVVHTRSLCTKGDTILLQTRRVDDDVVVELSGDAIGCDGGLARLQSGIEPFKNDDMGFGLWFVRCEMLLHEARLVVSTDPSGDPKIALYFPALRS